MWLGVQGGGENVSGWLYLKACSILLAVATHCRDGGPTQIFPLLFSLLKRLHYGVQCGV